jgi:hypothetical protein
VNATDAGIVRTPSPHAPAGTSVGPIRYRRADDTPVPGEVLLRERREAGRSEEPLWHDGTTPDPDAENDPSIRDLETVCAWCGLEHSKEGSRRACGCSRHIDGGDGNLPCNAARAEEAIADAEARNPERADNAMQPMTLERACAIAARAYAMVPDDREWIEQELLKELRGLHARSQTTGLAPSEAGLNVLAARIHGLNRKWWYDGEHALPRNKGELMMLMVTEIAEGFEGERKGLMDDKLPHRPMAEVELVDAIVRILDYAGAYGYDLDGAFREKLAYNAKREDHKVEASKIAHGNPLECRAVTPPAGQAPKSEGAK